MMRARFCLRLMEAATGLLFALLWLPGPLLAVESPSRGDGGTWTAKAPAPTKRTEVAAAAIGGKIYVVGGFSEPGLGNLMNLAISDAVEEYDPISDRWTTRSPLPVGLHHTGAVALGERLYVIGGFTKSFLSVWHPVASVYVYHPATDSWKELASMSTARGALAVAEVGGKLFAIGGYDGSGNSAAVEMYDPATNTWSKKAPLPTPRDHLAAAAVGTRIYAIGGRLNRDYGRNLATTEVYDTIADRWTRVSDLPTPRSGITAGVVRGSIYVVGGEAPEGTFQTNEAYSPETDRWRTMAPMPTGRHGLGSATIQDRLYVISGGPTPGGSFSNVNEVFTAPDGPLSSVGHVGPEHGRALARQVGTIMALLTAFQDAGVLPSESSPDANRLIRALIQFQAAFMKSPNPEVSGLLTEALRVRLGDHAEAEVEAFRVSGWTSQSLEAVVEYMGSQPVWDRPALAEGFRAYNIGREDFDLLSHVFRAARQRLEAQGQDLHGVYASRRREMPGAGL